MEVSKQTAEPNRTKQTNKQATQTSNKKHTSFCCKIYKEALNLFVRKRIVSRKFLDDDDDDVKKLLIIQERFGYGYVG